MAELGCTKDGSFNNLEVEGFATINNSTTLLQQKVIYSRVKTDIEAPHHTDLDRTTKHIFWQPIRSIITSIELVVIDGWEGGGEKNATAEVGVSSTLASVTWQNSAGTVIEAGAYFTLTMEPDVIDALLADLRVNTSTEAREVRLSFDAADGLTKGGTFAWIISFKQF